MNICQDKNMPIVNIGEKVKSLRERNGLNQTQFAEKIGVKQGFISKVESNLASFTVDHIILLRNIFSLDMNWFFSGEDTAGDLRVGSVYEEHCDDYSGYVQVPRYEISASAGGGVIVQSEQIVDHLAFKGTWLKNQLGLSPASAAVISVDGDSMEPYLSDGDLILIDSSVTRIKNDSIYVLQYGDSLLVKRIQVKRDGTVIVKSDNERYEPEIFRGDAVLQLRVVGRVVRRLVR